MRMSALGHRGHGKTRKQGKQTQKRLCNTYFGVYGRGNFPGHDVLRFSPNTDKNRIGWAVKDAHGRNGGCHNGGKQKHNKKPSNFQTDHVFATMI